MWIPLIIGIGYLLSRDDKPKAKGMNAAKYFRDDTKIITSSLNPRASIKQIKKIISGKAYNYNFDRAVYTKSEYISFYDDAGINFEIRVSDHTKKIHSRSKLDYDEVIIRSDEDISINIFDGESKKMAIDFLKNHFKNKKSSKSKDVFIYEPVVKPKMELSDKVKELLLKYKINITKSEKQIKSQIIKLLIKKKPIALLKKGRYQGTGRRTKRVGTITYKGKIIDISSTGNQATITSSYNGELVTSREFEIKNKNLNLLLEIAKSNSHSWDYLLKSINYS